MQMSRAMKLIPLLFWLVTFAVAVAAVGCGDDKPDPKTPASPTSTDPSDRRPMQ